MEICLWSSFVATLFLLMLKSRCCKVGIDNSKQFEAPHMCFLANKIVLSLLDQQNQISPNAIYRKHKFVGRERTVEVNEVPIKIQLSEEQYDAFLSMLETIVHTFKKRKEAKRRRGSLNLFG